MLAGVRRSGELVAVLLQTALGYSRSDLKGCCISLNVRLDYRALAYQENEFLSRAFFSEE